MRILAALILVVGTIILCASVPITAHAVMPDKTATPGETNPAVTQATIKATICKSGWTKTIRPPASYTNALKKKQLGSGPYASKLKPAAFEEDHLISLEIGGSPTSEKNLWPEPYNPKDGMGARKKDQVETALKREICAGKKTLGEAQAEVLDWETSWNARYAKKAPRK